MKPPKIESTRTMKEVLDAIRKTFAEDEAQPDMTEEANKVADDPKSGRSNRHTPLAPTDDVI